MKSTQFSTRLLPTLPFYAFSLLTTYLLLRPGSISSGSTPFGDFRCYFSFDQLTYAGIASNAAAGNLSLVEPFTETGVSYYPSLWYLLLGSTAGLLGVGIPAVWTLLGGLAIAVSIIIVGWFAQRLSGRPWAPGLVGPALWIGPLALAIGEHWYLPLQSHALLWGPYGALFTLNAEAVGLSAGATALVLLLAASLTPHRSRRVVILVGTAGLIVGLLANVHTYAFLVTIGFIATWVAVTGLAAARAHLKAVLIGLTLAIVGTVVSLGVLVTPLRESLAIFALMLVAGIPGALVVTSRLPRAALVGGIAVILGALPQALSVVQGLAVGDSFLTYRQVQSASLGIDLLPFILATLPIGFWVLAVTLATWKAPLPLAVRSALASGLLALSILSFNDLWGFVQEPYRMWIASLILLTLLAVPLTAYALADSHYAWRGKVTRAIAAAAVAAIALSWWNLGGFRSFVSDIEPIAFGSSRLTALTDLTRNSGGLFASDPCVDPLQLKVASRERVAFYSEGLAWPSDRESIDEIIRTRRDGVMDIDALRSAGVTYLVTDTQCSAAWESDLGDAFVLVGERSYQDEGSSGLLKKWLLR